MDLISDTGERFLSSHDHRFSAVTVWDATIGRFSAADMVGVSQRRAEGEQRGLVAASSIHSRRPSKRMPELCAKRGSSK